MCAWRMFTRFIERRVKPFPTNIKVIGGILGTLESLWLVKDLFTNNQPNPLPSALTWFSVDLEIQEINDITNTVNHDKIVALQSKILELENELKKHQENTLELQKILEKAEKEKQEFNKDLQNLVELFTESTKVNTENFQRTYKETEESYNLKAESIRKEHQNNLAERMNKGHQHYDIMANAYKIKIDNYKYLLNKEYNKQAINYIEAQEKEHRRNIDSLKMDYQRSYIPSEEIGNIVEYCKKIRAKILSETNRHKEFLKTTLLLTRSLFDLRKIVNYEERSFMKEYEQIKIVTKNIPLLEKVIESIPQNSIDNGVKSIKQLKSEFSRLRNEEKTIYGYDNVLSQITSVLRDIISSPPEGLVEGHDVPSILSRAYFYVSTGALNNAIFELKKLDGPEGQIFSNWIKAAQERQILDQSLVIFSLYLKKNRIMIGNHD